MIVIMEKKRANMIADRIGFEDWFSMNFKDISEMDPKAQLKMAYIAGGLQAIEEMRKKLGAGEND